jgi:hypothetical protein
MRDRLPVTDEASPAKRGKRRGIVETEKGDEPKKARLSSKTTADDDVPEQFSLDHTTTVVREKFGLKDAEIETLRNAVCQAEEDPVLVIRPNPIWVAPAGGPTYDQVMDAIATFQMVGGKRRDSQAGCHRWIFHFEDCSIVGACERHIKATFPATLGITADCVAFAAAYGAPMPAPPVPMGFASLIHKINVRSSDVYDRKFFYF